MIKITKRGWNHILKHHTSAQQQGRKKKSIFNANEDLILLINQAAMLQPVGRSRRHLVRIFDAGHPVGIDCVNNQATSLVTLLTRLNGDLVTMFPGTL